MSSGRRTNEQQATYTRQVTILRKNLIEWDKILHTPRGEDWPTMIGRSNAAFNQIVNIDKNCIDDVMEHFVYVPKRTTANPQDIPFFLSTRLEIPPEEEYSTTAATTLNTTTPHINNKPFEGDPVERLTKYERNAAKLASHYEETMIRF